MKHTILNGAFGAAMDNGKSLDDAEAMGNVSSHIGAEGKFAVDDSFAPLDSINYASIMNFKIEKQMTLVMARFISIAASS